ncbi:hypothetical protein CSE45_4877 [Citreicella sp. SE45]|nr:hypothetical protein CSE45_4877 [Citreicella sp. SE45]
MACLLVPVPRRILLSVFTVFGVFRMFFVTIADQPRVAQVVFCPNHPARRLSGRESRRFCPVWCRCVTRGLVQTGCEGTILGETLGLAAPRSATSARAPERRSWQRSDDLATRARPGRLLREGAGSARHRPGPTPLV